MKTDPFEDAIRRKLESIEPPFREKSWTQMQAFMRQHGFPPAWYGVSQWLLPMAASVVLVTLVATNVWQYRTNQQLEQTVQALKQTVARLEKQQIHPQSTQSQPTAAQLAVPRPAGAPASDTVYVTQYVEVPAAARAAPSPNQPAVPTNEVARLKEVPESTKTVDNQKRSPENQVIKTIETTGAARDGVSASQPRGRETNWPPPRERPSSSTNTETLAAAAPAEVEKRTPALANAKPRPGDGAASADRRENALAEEKNVVRSSQAVPSDDFTGPATPPNGSALRPLALQSLSSRAIARDSGYFPDWMARRARKIRSLLPQSTVVATIPIVTEPAISRVPKLARFRLGASGELAVGQWSAGIYSEVRVVGNWLLGVGLNRLSLSGGQFLTDELFNAKTKRDFRREYAFGIDPRQEILNIDRRSYTWQVPISVGYRLGLPQGLALIPSVGATFSLTAREQTTFTYRRGPREFLGAECLKDRPTEWYHNYTVAVAVEKQWNRFVAQIGPFVTGPFQAVPEQINTPSVGVRTRVLFQF